MASPASTFAQQAASRLKFPQLFGVLMALFLFDLVFPDLIPFVDEILLGLGAALFGVWRERVPTPDVGGGSTEIKNVTPRE